MNENDFEKRPHNMLVWWVYENPIKAIAWAWLLLVFLTLCGIFIYYHGIGRFIVASILVLLVSITCLAIPAALGLVDD